MSSDFADLLQQAIKTSDSEALVALIEPRIKEGTATESESLLCGVTNMMPPFADPEAASAIFCRQLQGDRAFEAAVWDAYRFAVLMPDKNRSFERVLKVDTQSSIGAHMRSMVAYAGGDLTTAISENRKSRARRLFPFNILDALQLEPALLRDERRRLWLTACDLIRSRSSETDVEATTIEGALQNYFENLILGTRITSPLWDHYDKRFGGI